MKAKFSDLSNQQLFWVLAALVFALAAWVGYSAFAQWQSEQRESKLLQIRDASVGSLQGKVNAHAKRLGTWRDSAEAQAAVAQGESQAIAHLRAQWPELQEVESLPANLSALYRDPAAAGFGRLAVAEAALAADAPVSRVIAIDGSPMVMLAVPVGMGVPASTATSQPTATTPAVTEDAPSTDSADTSSEPAADAAALAETEDAASPAEPAPTVVAPPAVSPTGFVGVLLGRLPVNELTDVVHQASLPSGAYLALRQGTHSLAERGNTQLASLAEARASKVGDSSMRVAAAAPEPAEGMFGLGAIGAAIVALVLALVGIVLVMKALGRALPIGKAKESSAPVAATNEPTLEQALTMQPPPLPDAAALQVTDLAAEPASAEADAAEPQADTSLEFAPASTDTLATAEAGIVPDASIFRAYDIRGVVGQQLSREVAEAIGLAIGTVMAEQDLQDIVVGRDGRLSGPDLIDGLTEGLRRAGRNVIDIGMAPTPVVYFATYQLNTGCGVAVTGSHNPPDYNGFKIVVGGTTLAGDAITDLHSRIATGRLHQAPQRGSLSQQSMNEDYVKRIAGDVQLQRPLKVVVDAGNGVAGELGPQVLRAIGADVIELYCEIDGNFPNHHPDPSEPHNLNDLVAKVAETGAELGIAFDGDGDRLGVVTADGQNIFPDRLLMLFAEDVLERNPGAMIIYDVKCSGRLHGHVLMHGGSPLMWKTGHSLVKAKMRETDAELAGEMSGHFFFGERWYGFDDGIYAAARLLEIVSQRAESPSEVLNALPDGISTPEIKVQAPGGDPHAFVSRFRDAASFPGARNTTIDGLRVDFDDGWGLVRASNTTPVLVMRFDADSPEALARIQSAFREQLLGLQPDLDLPF